MNKLKKRILALGLSLVMILTMIPLFASVALAEDAATVKVYLTVSIQGELAKANDGSLMVCKEVTVTDLNEDGTFTYDEALVAAHAAYNSQDGFAVSSSGWVTSVWSIANNAASYSFIQNDKATDLVTTAVISEGDDLVTSVNKDGDEYSDIYTAFDEKQVEITAGEQVSLTLSGFGAMTTDSAKPVSGITIGYYNANGEYVPTEIVTDEDGKASISFAEPGTYVVSGRGTYTQTISSWNYSQFSPESDVYVKITDYTTYDMVVPYTEQDYGEGPYPFDELKFDLDYYDFDDMTEEEQAAIHYMKSNQVLMDSPIIAPVSVITVKEAPVELTDGTYAIPGLSTAVLSMYHFDPDTARVVIKGNDAWLITSIDGTKEASTLKRFDGMAYGPQSEILDPSDETNHTLIEGTSVAKVIEIYGDDKETVVGRTFVLPVPKSIFANGSDIYYMIKYCAGYSATHDGDWYKASGGDYYLTGYTLEKISDSTDLPGDEEPETIELEITNNTGMFKAVTATAVENADGSAALTFALSGTGYHYLYKGTYEQAVKNGTAIENWVAGVLNADGKWEFQMTILADELGKAVPVVAVSDSYYNKYLNGQNSLERAFYPRQLNLDLDAATLVTGDYEAEKTIAVTNNVGMFNPGSTATLECVGGPNSNNYKADLVLPMTTTSMNAIFVGTPAEAAEEGANIIAFDTASNTFTIPVKWVESFGQPETTVNLCNGEPFVLSFRSARNGNWYGRQATINEDDGTMVFDPWVDPAPANTVDELIAKIQSQVFTDTTYADCDAAKAAWDALSDAEKALVEEYDYFGLDTGDASADNPLNGDKIGKNEILVVSFGTSFNDSRVDTIGGVEKAIAAAYPDWSVRRAFTAQIIINHIYARDGEKIDNVEQALDRAVDNGVETLIVQPTHLMHGAEYDELMEALEPYQDKMTIVVSEPLLGEVGDDSSVINEDKLAVAEAVVEAACADAGYKDPAAAAADGAAIVLMGHGTEHVANVTYEQMQTAMSDLGYANVFVGTVEGLPESTECSNVIDAVKDAGYTKVFLRPLMVVAGDHANNDMADPEDEESWYSQFTADGSFESVTCQIAGLGEIEAVQQIYVAHIFDAALDQILFPNVPADYTNVAKGTDGNWYYVKDGKVQLHYTGVQKNENGWWMVVDGKVDFNYTGFGANEYGWWYVEKGQVTFKKNDILPGTVDGEEGWWLVKESKLTSATTIAQNKYGWWKLEDGKVNFEFTGIANNDYGWWYLKEGQVDFTYTGFAENEYGMWYVEKGQITFKTNDVIKDKETGIWWLVEGSKVSDKTTVAKNANGWWKITDGKVDFAFTGLAKNDNGWWYLKDGKVDFNFTGFEPNENGWWYVEKGQITFKKNDVIHGMANDYTTKPAIDGWWYVRESRVALEPETTVAQNANGWWYINFGRVDFNYNGVGHNEYGNWYIKNGQVDFKFNGMAYGYRFVNGKAVGKAAE